MLRTRTARLFTLLTSMLGAAGLLAAGCAGAGGGEVSDAFVVPADKADDFLSLSAQEYKLEGTTSVTLEPELAAASEEQKLARVRELIPLKQIVIGWFLNAYLKPHDSHSDSDYGGFDCLTKNGSYEDLDITPLADGLSYSFRFRQEIGGTMDLLEKLPAEPLGDGRYRFELTIGKIGNDEMAQLETNHEWYRRAPWSDFDPESVDPERLETVELTIWAEPRSVDAWIDSAALFADGELSVAVHFGWDYHNAYHLEHSAELYRWLVDRGYRSPVDSYGEYDRSSGPLTRTIQAFGRPVEVSVWLYWGEPGSDTDPDTDAGGRQLEADMRDSFRTKEVIVFSGHSGPFYGFALANWRRTLEGDLDDSEIPELDMPADVYQVVLAEGCETYALGQAFWDNPNKSDRTMLDVLTTTSFSNAAGSSTLEDFLQAVAGTGPSDDRHQAQTYGQLLRDLDSNSYWFNTMYGVHGLDDNPHLHPYADAELYCTACERDSDCGQGHKCARVNERERVCLGMCTADDGCPAGWQCMDVASGWTRQWQACVPANLTCEQEPEPPAAPQLMLNEVLADPPPGPAGDANGDGVREASADEFVEIVNHGGGLVELAGYALADNTGTRFVFPAGATLMSGEAVVVFGGGQPPAALNGSLTHAADPMLGLNNAGDAVVLIAPDGSQVDRLSYDSAFGGRDCAMVRARDGDPEAGWVSHCDQGTPFSPGSRSDGSPF